MQYELPQEEEGCFVFQVVNSPISARSQPNILNEDKTRLEFEVGELVSIDFIQHCSDKQNGPFLRLTDRSGWLFGMCMGQERMRQLPVERGLWTRYVDNFPNGQYLRRHPVVSPDLDLEMDGENVLYEPATKLFCDAKVIHPMDGITFYRVQGTRGWVFDHVPATETSPARTMLLDEDKVRTGLFCFQAVQDVVIRLKPNTDEDCMTREVIKSGEIVAVNYIRESEDSQNGPFLRLSDGMGWLFAKKQGVPMMQNLTVEVGSWVIKCLNAPVGVGLRRHPIVCQDKLYPVVYPTGSMLQCDRKVVAKNGTNFYHVVGTRGWLFDRRGSNMILELVSFQPCGTQSMHMPWDPNFVRGVAATVDDLCEKEDLMDDQKGILTFERQGTTTLVFHIYCKSRTVVVFLDGEHQICENDCTTKRLVAILQLDSVTLARAALQISQDESMPQEELAAPPSLLSTEVALDIANESGSQGPVDVGVEIMTNHSIPRDECSAAEQKEVHEVPEVNESVPDANNFVREMIDSDPAEIALRQKLISLESTEHEMRVNRMNLMRQLKTFDDERCSDALMAKHLTEERLKEMKDKEIEEVLGIEEEKLTEMENVPDATSSIRLLLSGIPDVADSVSFLGRTEGHSPADNISPRSQTSIKSRRSLRTGNGKSSRRRDFVCGECREIFRNPEDREDHCREEHGIVCDVCDKVFKSFRALDAHKDDNDHW